MATNSQTKILRSRRQTKQRFFLERPSREATKFGHDTF
jgi:hypothetical protein